MAMGKIYKYNGSSSRPRNYKKKYQLRKSLTNFGTNMTKSLSVSAERARSFNQLKNVVAKLASNAQVEYKINDTTGNGTAMTMNAANTQSQFYLGIAQGTTETTRIGDAIQVKSIFLRSTITWDPVLAGTQGVRIIIARVMTPGLALTLGNLLEVSTNFRSPLNILSASGENNYSIIVDKMFSLSEQIPRLDFKRYIKCDFTTKYTGGTSDPSDVAVNRLVMWVMSDSGNGTSSGPLWFDYVRIRYIDG